MSIRQRPRIGTTQSHRRSGQALIEFAFVSIVMVTLFTVAFSLGLMLLQSMVTANAGASAGRILHHHPRLSPEAFAWMREYSDLDFEFNVADPSASEVFALITYQDDDFTAAFGSHLYDETMLLLETEQYDDKSFLQRLPVLNQILLPHYIYDPDWRLFRYPGAVVANTDENIRTILIPLINTTTNFRCFDTGEVEECDEVAAWLPPLRICKLGNTCNCETGDTPDQLAADGEFSIVITYPAQAGALVQYIPRMVNNAPVYDSSGRRKLLKRDIVDDNLQGPPEGYELLEPDELDPRRSLASRGIYGLGELEVLDMSEEPFTPILVRPYRRVIEHSSTFRLGQRFEAMYELNADSTATPQPIEPGDAQPNSFQLTNKRFDNAVLFPNIDDNPPVMAARIPVSGKWRIQASGNLRDSNFTTEPDGPERFLIKLSLLKTGETTSTLVFAQREAFNDTVGPFLINGSVIIDASEGDTVEVQISHNHPDDLSLEGSEANWISLEAVFLRDQPRMPIPDAEEDEDEEEAGN